jgi:hypothetical protein
MTTKLVKDTLYKADGVNYITYDTLIFHYPKQGYEAKALDTIIMSDDSNGFMYLYRSIDGSTVYLDKPIDKIHEDVPEPVVAPVMRFADTCMPSTKEFKTFTSFEPHYFKHGIEKKESANYDHVIDVASFPVLVLMTIAYAYRAVAKNSWGNFFSEIMSC